MWRTFRTEWRRTMLTWPAWVATAVVLVASLLGLQTYASLGIGAGLAWHAFSYAVVSVGIVVPIVAAVGFGDRMAGDARSGYLALALMRVPPRTLLLARLACMAVGAAVAVLLGLLPALVLSFALYPATNIPFGTALSVYAAPDWVVTGSNLGTLVLASAAWAVFMAMGVGSLVWNPRWLIGGSILGYLIATVTLPSVVNPMVRVDLASYVPAVGALWTDAVWWVVWGALGAVVGMSLWMRRRQILAG